MSVLKTMYENIAFGKPFAMSATVPEHTPDLKFQIGDRVVIEKTAPNAWHTGVVIGIQLNVYYSDCTPYWSYCVHLDAPIGSREWVEEGRYLHAESESDVLPCGS
jgi:hypothetical protein